MTGRQDFVYAFVGGVKFGWECVFDLICFCPESFQSKMDYEYYLGKLYLTVFWF